LFQETAKIREPGIGRGARKKNWSSKEIRREKGRFMALSGKNGGHCDVRKEGGATRTAAQGWEKSCRGKKEKTKKEVHGNRPKEKGRRTEKKLG